VGGETLLLTLLALFVVLVEALLPPNPPLLHEGRPVPLPLLRGAASGLRLRRRWVRSGGMNVHRLQAGTIRQTKNTRGETKDKGKQC
jgi:hypothetical protein